MKNTRLDRFLILVGIFAISTNNYAEEHEHEHGEDSHESQEDNDHDDHEDEHEGEHGHEDSHEEEKNDRFGPGKAILAASKKQGIQLAEKAIATLGVSSEKVTQKITMGVHFQLPLSAAVFYQNEVGIYRFKDGWFKLIEVDVVSKTKTHITVKNKPKHLGLTLGDAFAKSGVPLLRAAELEAWGGSGDGHGH